MKNPTSEILTRGWALIPTPQISAHLLERVYSDWSYFFEHTEKENFKAGPGDVGGYFPWYSETALDSEGPDSKEFFHWYRDGNNPLGCEESTSELFDELREVTAKTFAALAMEDFSLKTFATDIDKSERLVLRIAHYRPTTSQYFNAPHEDIDFLTLLPKASKPGLEVLEGEQWVPANVGDGQCIILCGELSTEATSGKIKAARHRVIASDNERLSLSFFVNPNDDVRISSRGTAGELLTKRLKEIYV